MTPTPEHVEASIRVTSSPAEPWYTHYRAIKYAVFGRELGWHVGGSETDPIADPNEFDRKAAFSFLCADERPVGTVRGSLLRNGFAHESLFARHLRRREMIDAVGALCTLNAVALLPAYRRRHFLEPGRVWSGSGGRLLVLAQIEFHRANGAGGAILTSATDAATRFFQKLGFKPIDHPTTTPLHPNPLTNMAVAFHDERLVAAALDCGVNLPAKAADASMEAFQQYIKQISFGIAKE